jgi:hypothetical protein
LGTKLRREWLTQYPHQISKALLFVKKSFQLYNSYVCDKLSVDFNKLFINNELISLSITPQKDFHDKTNITFGSYS